MPKKNSWWKVARAFLIGVSFMIAGWAFYNLALWYVNSKITASEPWNYIIIIVAAVAVTAVLGYSVRGALKKIFRVK